MQVKPVLTWDKLTNDTPSDQVEKVFQNFEQNCGLANDNKGMAPKERLITLKSILKGAKEKIYENKEKLFRATGEWDSDPEGCYLSIKARLLRFVETTMQKRTRLKGTLPDLSELEKL